MGPGDILNAGGSLASFGGLFLSIVQWFKAAASDETRQTIEDYLEWLRRENHTEILTAIQDHTGELGAIREIIASLRGAFLEALNVHERASQERHRLLLKAQAPSPPKLSVSFKRRFREQPFTRAFIAVLRIVNEGGQMATVENGLAILSFKNGRRVQADLIYRPEGFLSITGNGGAAVVELLTNPQPIGGTGEMPSLDYVELRLSQDSQSRRFEPAEGDTLKESFREPDARDQGS